MHLHIRHFMKQDTDEVLELTLLAFEPIFISFASILGPNIYPIIYPDWQQRQKDGVRSIITNEKMEFWVAEVDGKVVGYIAFEYYSDNTGEVQLLAVHPDHQNHGIGTRLNDFALDEMRKKGIKLAIVSTGGDESHAPARKCYEKAGYTALPLVRYYQDL